MTVHYLGPPGSFSEQAAIKLADRRGGDETLPQPTVEAVAKAVAEAEPAPAAGVLPYYNLLEGLVQESLDLAYEYLLVIDDAIRVPVTFALGTLSEEVEKDEVVSHPKGLAQCSDYLSAKLARARLTPVGSTSEAAKHAAANANAYAVSSRSALEHYGLKIVANDIGNVRQGKRNFTDFFAVSSAESTRSVGRPAERTLIAIAPRIDRPGLLAGFLSQFSFFDINIAKIHSRPAPIEIAMAGEPQMFYLEVLADPASPALGRCLDAIRYRLSSIEGGGDREHIRIMGSFVLDD